MISQAFVALTALTAPLAMAARPSPGGALTSFTGGDATVRQLLTAKVYEGPIPCSSSLILYCIVLYCTFPHFEAATSLLRSMAAYLHCLAQALVLLLCTQPATTR